MASQEIKQNANKGNLIRETTWKELILPQKKSYQNFLIIVESQINNCYA